jgi:hypothetical protein
MKLLIPIAILLVASLGCSKDKDENPAIIISSPVMGKVFTNGEPIQIKGSVSDDEQINELHVILIDMNTGAPIITFDSEPRKPSVSFDHFATNAVSGTHYRIQVIAKDNHRNDGRTLVEFICN